VEVQAAGLGRKLQLIMPIENGQSTLESMATVSHPLRLAGFVVAGSIGK
jgi:hypothetical protein